MNRFWLVWEPNSGYTHHRHESKSDAVEESKRLAQQHTDKQFYVLEALSVSRVVSPVENIELEAVVPF